MKGGGDGGGRESENGGGKGWRGGGGGRRWWVAEVGGGCWAGLIVTAGWDRKVLFWDTQSAKSIGRLKDLLVEVESVSLSGYHLMVAAGKSLMAEEDSLCPVVREKSESGESSSEKIYAAGSPVSSDKQSKKDASIESSYSGDNVEHLRRYVTLDGVPKKNLFYYFVQSERNPSEDPLVLWLNGGPGCSSFDGFIYEHGPFNFEAAKTKGGLPTLHLNPYSWSKVSSMIYLESPSGVGLSYPAVNETGDIQTAIDTHAFLLKWLELYPEFISNPFYISGESYAGIYIPTLASEVVKGIKSGVKPAINFKGYLIGNGVCDGQYDGNSLVPFAHGMALISNALYQEAVVKCKENYQDPKDQSCLKVIGKIDETLDGLNIYDILEPCYHDNSSENDVKKSSLPQSFKQLGRSNQRPLPVRKRMFGRAWPFRAVVKPGPVRLWPELSPGFDDVPCMNVEVATAWLNNKDVRKAIHARLDRGKWSLCGGLIRYIHDAGSMISYHKNLTADGYRALIFSGDHDMCVPYTGTQAWVESLGYQVEEEWRPWISDYQVAGYIQKYAKNLTFLTIKGAGHTVPEYKPRESLDFYSRWLQGQSI